MSEYFKAAARCDIAVVKKSPVPIDEKAIIEEEMKARQWDTLATRAEQATNSQNNDFHTAQLEVIRQKEMEERMRKIRLEEKRKQALIQKEKDRLVKEEMERQRVSELEAARLLAIEQKRQTLVAEREQSRLKAEQKMYEQQLKRLQRTAPHKSVDEQAAELPEEPSNLSYMERMRMEKERMGRMAKLYDGKTSIQALYETPAPTVKSAGVTKLEMDISLRKRMDEERLKAQREELLRQEEEDRKALAAKRKAVRSKVKTENEEWLAKFKEEAALSPQKEEEESLPEIEEAFSPQSTVKEHPIDVMHKQIAENLMAEAEAIAATEENLRWGFSQVDRLEEIIEAERDAWRQQLQHEREDGIQSPGAIDATQNWRLKPIK